MGWTTASPADPLCGPEPILNLQDVRGKAKVYQVRQLLQLVERYNLSLGGEE